MTAREARTLHRVLVANRGEIALRVNRACRDAGLESVAIYAEQDADLPFVRAADHAVALGGRAPARTYLDIGRVLAAAAQAQADAVHPGYGFLAENADFAQAVLAADLVWVGPPPDVIRVLGDKVSARALAAAAGLRVLPGTPRPVTDPASIAAFAERHGFPIAIKATHGGGGRGMRVARDLASAAELLASAMRESAAAFGHDGCFLESYVERARHVEAQVLADEYRHVAVIGSRDCSVQRRFQKLIEEAPAPFLSGEQRDDLARAAEAICRAAGYVNAGTVEFLLSPSGEITFMEVNTRLQVEHTVTEETSGIDLVRAQLLLAAGQPLDAVPGVSAYAASGGGDRHSIQMRINSEDPATGFMPTTGTLTAFLPSAGPGVRVDAGVRVGSQIGGQFDSLLAKLVVTGHSRTETIERARRALGEFEIAGLPTTAPFLAAVLNEPAFAAPTAGQFGVHTRWVEEDLLPALNERPAGGEPTADRPVAVRIGTRWLAVDVPGLTRAASGPLAAARRQAGEARSRGDGTDGAETLISPMQGTVSRVTVAEGQRVAVGQVLILVEAMKMENPVRASRAGLVTALRVAAGDVVAQGAILCRVRTEDAE